MKNKYSLYLSTLIGTLILTLAATVAASAFDACRNVRFTVRNDRNGVITLKKVSYFNANENRWRDEDIPNSELSRGEQVTVAPQDLQNAEGDRLTKIKFEYLDHNDNKVKMSAVFLPTSPDCVAEKNYGYGQGWAITGSSSVQEDNNPLTGDKCKSVTVKFDNGRDGDIRIRKVKFYNKNAGDWKTEDVFNSTCAFGSSNCEIKFSGAGGFLNVNDSNGDDLTKVVLVYEFKANTRGANWSDAIDSKTFEPSSPMCKEGKIYGQGQNWRVGNDTVANTSTNENVTPTTTAPSSSTMRRRGAGARTTSPAATTATTPVAGNQTSTVQSESTTTNNNRRRRKNANQQTEESTSTETESTSNSDQGNKRRKRTKKPND